MSRIVFLDTETTGLDPEREQVFEVAAIGATSGLEWVWRIQPHAKVVARMHPKAIEVNRYRERTTHPDWSWHDPSEVMLDLYGMLDGAHICGAVPDFDARHLTSLYRGFGQDPPRWHYHLIDIEAMAVGWLDRERLELGRSGWQAARSRVELLEEVLALPWDSDALSRACGVEPPGEDERHTALGDARWCKRLYEAITGGAP